MLNHVDDAKRRAALRAGPRGSAVRPRARARRGRPGLPRPLLPPDARHHRPPREPADGRSARTRSTGSPRSCRGRCSSAPTSTRSATSRSATAATTAGRSPSWPDAGGRQAARRRDDPADRDARLAGRRRARDLGAGRRDRPRRPRRHRPRAGRRGALPHRLGRALGGPRRLPRRRAGPRHASSPTGSPSAASRSPAATPGATAPCPPRTRARPFEVPQTLNVRHGVFIVENLDTVGARRRRRARVRPDPHPPQAARRHRRLDLPDRPRLRGSDAMPEHYDVIIIGTGAGGGTLAHRLAPSGKRILLLERGGYLPREPENWDSQEVFRRERYVTSERVDRQGRRAVPPAASSTSSAATRSSTARSSSGCASATSARSATTAASRPRGRSPTPSSSPTTREAERLYLVHGAAPARTRPSRRARARSRTRRSPTSRASSSCTTTSLRTGHHPFHLPVGVDLDESDPEAGRCVRCDRFDGFPCLADGKADAHVLCVRPALQHDNVTLRTPLEGDAARDRRLGAAASPASSSSAAARARPTAPTSSSCPAAPPTRPRCCCARPTTRHPNGLANSSDVGRAATTWPTSTPA